MFDPRWPEYCPKCRSTMVQFIVHGLPGATLIQWLKEGKAIEDSCIITPWMPDWICSICKHEWFDPDDPWKKQSEELLASILARHAQARGGPQG